MAREARLRERFFEELVVQIDAGTADSWREFAAELIKNTEPEGLVAAMLSELQLATGRLSGGYNVEVPPAPPAREAIGPGAARPAAPRQRPTRPELPGDRAPRPGFGKKVADVAGGEKPRRLVAAASSDAPEESRPKRASRERQPKDIEPGMVRLQLNIGKVDRVVPGYLVRTICAKAGVTAEALGAISIQARHSFVDVRAQVVNLVVGALDGSKGERGHRWAVLRA